MPRRILRIIRKFWREIYFNYPVQRFFFKYFYLFRFNKAVSEWHHVPVDEVGYFDTRKLMHESDDALIRLTRKFEDIRYGTTGWRNYRGLWRFYSGVQTILAKHVLDFGCGFGIEALQFAKNGNRVSIADISLSNLQFAERILMLHGFRPLQKILVSGDTPYFECALPIQVFYSNGVLHHTPKFREILRRAASQLDLGGEIRLMLYSDKAWEIATRASLPSIHEDITKNRFFYRYVRFYDSYGEYADWYSLEKLESRVGDFLTIKNFNYITRDSRYLMTTLEVK
ncbi:MAG TPA: class I SAM-dependent methyltransferase [Candidatus Omnitrophota bacterium]|nr:class I SAM-dependent methyltransferase [Candidatus Omnitrophota bacterium]